MLTATASNTPIDVIDRQIDVNRAALATRVRAIPQTAWGWQTAWDRCPDLYARDCELMRQRGVAQQERHAQLNAEYRREQRIARAAQRKAA